MMRYLPFLSIVSMSSALLVVTTVVIIDSGSFAARSLEVQLNPTPTGGGTGKISFYSTNAQDHGIYIMDADGTNQHKIVGEPYDYWGVWSPDGRQIAFSSGYGILTYEIYIMNADGSDRHQLTQNKVYDGEPSWSPDGKQMIYVTELGNDFEARHLFIMDTDGNNIHRLSTNTSRNQCPMWSPQGNEIAFVARRDNQSFLQAIYIIDTEGNILRRLFSRGTDPYCPSWSPDGKRIAFTAYSLDNKGWRSGWYIYIVDADGTDLQRVAPVDPGIGIFPVPMPSWSPDGKQITFHSSSEHPVSSNSVDHDFREGN